MASFKYKGVCRTAMSVQNTSRRSCHISHSSQNSFTVCGRFAYERPNPSCLGLCYKQGRLHFALLLASHGLVVFPLVVLWGSSGTLCWPSPPSLHEALRDERNYHEIEDIQDFFFKLESPLNFLSIRSHVNFGGISLSAQVYKGIWT